MLAYLSTTATLKMDPGPQQPLFEHDDQIEPESLRTQYLPV